MSDFPVDGLVPKKPSEAASFLEHHPEFDGRGTVIAILDTGVDPGAAGLQRTSAGEKKLIAVLDTSGGGDLDTSTVVSAESGGKDGEEKGDEGKATTIRGKSGRTLLLSNDVVQDNVSDKWHVGCKALFEIFPSGLVSRLKAERKRLWKKDHAEQMVQARTALEKFDAENNVSGKKTALSRQALLQRKELKARVELLEAQEKSREDLGPMVDCVVYQGKDGIWRALVDTDSSGDLRAKRPLRHFAAYQGDDSLEFEKWDEISQMNFCVNIFQDGNLLSIVVDSGAHGTHVASIAAGFHPGSPEMNGVAPGAQLVSIRIGDGRLDGMETGAAIIRGLNACADLGVDIINMSFGEPTRLPEYGRIAELATELVEKHGVIFVSSAGNAGPALSTVGAPGSTSEALIGVGAYVEPQMMLAAYAMKPGLTPAPINYTWSSRGPSYDGQLGVTISAPGAAITSVPEWTLMKSRLMNGTSMSSPNAAGGIALIVSGLKAKGIKYAPWTIKRAIRATASWIPGVEPHAQGRGLLQVFKAFDTLCCPPRGIHSQALYDVNVSSTEARTNAGPAKGIYIREPWESQPSGVREFIVNVSPRFPEHQEDSRQARKETFDQRIFFQKKDYNLLEVRLNVRCTQNWISAPSHLLMTATTKSFRVSVDLSAIPSSSDGNHQVPFGYVEAYDPDEPSSAGPLWSVPVTVIKAESCDFSREPSSASSSTTPFLESQVEPAASVARLRYDPYKKYTNVPFSPGHIVRHFIAVPAGASWMDVHISAGSSGRSTVPVGSSRMFYLHCLQMRQQSHYKSDELSTSIHVRQEPGIVSTRSMPVEEGGTVEVCVAQFWSSLGEGPVNIELRFNGVTPIPRQIILGPKSGGVARVNLRADLGVIGVNPSAKLKAWSQAIRPVQHLSKISVLPTQDARDAILGAYPPSRRPTYGLMLTYNIKQLESGKLTPHLPLLDDVLYESPYDSQMCMLFDTNKKLLHCSDAWPSAVTIPKGDITARVFVRHEDPTRLERLIDMPLVVERPLSSDIALSVHKTFTGACSGKDGFSRKLLQRGETCAVFFAAPLWSDVAKKLPKGVSAGDVLHGVATFGKRSGKDTASSGTDKRPGGYPVEWVILSSPGSPAEEPTLKEDSEKQDMEEKINQNSAATSGVGVDTKSTTVTKESEEVLHFRHILKPTLLAKVKQLEDLKAKTDDQFDKLFDMIVAQVKEIQNMVPATVVEQDQEIARELESQALSLVRTRLIRAVHKAKKEMPFLCKPTLAQQDNSGDQVEQAGTVASVLELCQEMASSINVDEVVLALAKTKASGDLDGVGESDKKKELTKAIGQRRAWVVEAMALKQYAQKFESDPSGEEVLQRLAENKDDILQLLRLDRHVHQGRYACALQVLDKMISDGFSAPDTIPVTVSKQDLIKLKAELFNALGWSHMEKEIRDSELLVSFPSDYSLF